MFWSNSTLSIEIPKHKIIEPYFNNKVDCNSYRLSIGSHVYVTPNHTKNHTPLVLKDNDSFCIPAGQFALILTNEILNIPSDVMGFISMRAKIKFRGLINVSGFHVDPGYNDRLTFSVYNASPKDITLHKSDDIFLLWLANIGGRSTVINTPNTFDYTNKEISSRISSEYINYVNLPFKSPSVLDNKIEALNNLIKIGGSVASVILVLVVTLAAIYIPIFLDLQAETKYLSGELNRQKVTVTQPIKAEVIMPNSQLKLMFDLTRELQELKNSQTITSSRLKLLEKDR